MPDEITAEESRAIAAFLASKPVTACPPATFSEEPQTLTMAKQISADYRRRRAAGKDTRKREARALLDQGHDMEHVARVVGVSVGAIQSYIREGA